MITHRMSVTFFLFGVVNLLSVKVTNGQQTDSTGNIHLCPVFILYPSTLRATFGKRVNFTGTVEAKLEYPSEGRWQRLQNGVFLKNINPDERKYLDTNALAPSQLVINNVDFDDVGEYRLQVRISTGWCSSNTVRLRHVYGILDYNASCGMTRECDERKHLQCSRKTCLCSNSHYPFNQACFPKSYLRAPIFNFNINKSSIYFEWTQPPAHSGLIKNYTVSIRHDNGTSITSKSVGKQTSYIFPYDFIPGYRYNVTIASNVQIQQPSEQFIESSELGIVLAPLPPGPIDRKQSNFHPEKLHLKWAVPINNTRVDSYLVTIRKLNSIINTSNPSTNDLEITSMRFEPGTNYTVTFYAKSYGSQSQPQVEKIQTLRTPLLTINPSGWPDIPYLSNLEVNCTIRNISNFPPILETKWQRNKLDFNISDAMYKGSSLDFFNPKLVINRIDFDRDDDVRYQCMAQNSEGWGSSLSDIRIDVKGSIKFLESCNYSRECLYGAHLTCSNRHCLCSYNYYHKNEVCYHRNYLRAQRKNIQSTTCDISITWNHPSQHAYLVTGYEVYLQEKTERGWKSRERVYAGNHTSYTTPCTLQSGRLYMIYIRSLVLLSNPTQTITVDTTFTEILEPRKPGAIVTNLSNFSADGLHLEWEESDGLVNRYRVRIDGIEQETLDSKPVIDWDQLLLPVTLYNVTITAISYGFTTNYHSYGKRESVPSSYWILTTQSQYTGKAFMSYGDGDYNLTGDDVTSHVLRSPTTVYIGDGTEDGFDSVVATSLTFPKIVPERFCNVLLHYGYKGGISTVIGTNGVIGLGETFNSGSIHAMDSKHVQKRQILCPFWTDLASKDNVGKVYYNTYRRGKDGASVDSAFMEKADGIVKKYFKDLKDFKATWLVKVTWENMTLYGHKEQKVTFQCFLITDGDNTFAVINYIDINLKTIQNLPISIGYRYKKFFVKNFFTNQNNAFRMSVVPGNRGERGFWIYKMTDGIKSKRDEKECFLWYSYNIENRIQHGLSHVLFDIQCPCDQRLIRFDPRYAINRFDETNRLLCYASLIDGNNIECCYDMYADVNHLGPLRRSAPFAGTVLQYSPFFQRYRYMNYDMKPRNLCCSTGHCDWYYEVRPIPVCYNWSPFQPAINFGDPHITTFDGLDYTFNGYGEYTMIKINTSTTSFTLQARTELATTENGTTINATIFSAFAAKDQTGSTVQIEMSRDKKGMIIIGNGIDLTNRFKNANYTFRKRNLTVYWQNRTITATFLMSLNTIKISLGKRFLICETLINEKFKGMTTGLMGNFDGNKTNDFILPNGTMLLQNATNTERKIFYNFGQIWSVNKESIFQYGDELSYWNYSHPEFVPMFTDEVDKRRHNEAIQKCGSNASKACVADYLATGDIALAEVSGQKEHDSKSDIATIENETPQISGNTTLHVEANKKVKLKFNVSDDDEEKPTLKLLKKPDDFYLDDETNTAIWTPRQSSIPEISIVAIDSQGAQSPSLEYNIVLCDGCGSHGECDYENTKAISGLTNKAGCKCQTGYSGERCNIDTDGCSQNPCPLERNCTDLPPQEEAIFGRGYNCSSCPLGYKDVENKCQDIDECESHDGNTCNKSKETCENTDGSYICYCVGGYRKLNQQCNDIDECLEKRSGCEQLCHNTHGSFSCSCLPGFGLNADNTTCSLTDDDICKNFEKKCEYSCSEIQGVTHCVCPSGYTLNVNGIICTDIDECSLATTPCDQECTNLNGFFQCTCRPGYSLEEDKTTCSRCNLPNYGVNCSQVCECGPGVDRCDSVSGCVCLSGWTGKSCDVDIDECQENPNICGTQRICVNNEGSYRCVCGEGLQLVDDICEDIDECSDDALNDCPPETTQCVNRFGNYSCECKPGFQGQGSDCKDIDECHLGIHKCSQVCQNMPGSYNCLCYFGFTLNDEDRSTCEIVKDSCSLYPNLICTYGCKRINEKDGMCFCESGYDVQSDGSCQDIDECQDPSTCDHNCTNKKGSFTCSCTVGYRLGNDGKSCTVCNPGFYGENCKTQCKCGRGSKECDNIKGCVCSPGWRGDTCEEDINECDSSPCTGDHEVCLNTPGSFRCDCVPGFKNSSGTCEDIDECQEPHVCHQLCTNTNGSYTCGCKAGYELINSKDCVDIDECAKDRCSKCSNWPGSFKCSCSDGYRLNATTLRDCENVDECQENIHNCSLNATCTDTNGSFRCSCHKGTQGDGYNCTVCSPFTYGDQCSKDCNCEKTQSEKCDAVTGSCKCRTGWTGDTCSQDVDECKEGIRTCNTSLHQVCVNDPGSSHCECLYGGNNLTHCIRPQSPIHITATDVKVKAEVRFDIKLANREEFLQHSEEWRIQIEETLRIFHHENVPGFSTLIVLSIRLGSLLVDYEIIGTKTQSNKNKFESGVASSMSKILKGEHKFKILNQEAPVLGVTMKNNNGSATMVITTPASPCYLLKAFYECPSGYHCDDSSNKAECVLNDFSELAIITISVGVGVPLLIAAIVIMIVWKRYQRKVLKLKEKSDNDKNLPVTLAGKIPRPKHSPSSEYDFIDSRSLNDGRYTDLGCINPNYSEDSPRERRYQVDDQFPIKRPNVGPDMTREY